jgi:glutamate-5-semialdehyde dehydrogenase
MSVEVVCSLGEAIEHVNLHGSGHTESIVTEDQENAGI